MRFPQKGRNLMKGNILRLNVFWAMLSLSLFISCLMATGAVAAPYRATLPISPEAVCPLLNGQKIPPLTLKTLENESFDLAAAIAKKPTILIFYRGGW